MITLNVFVLVAIVLALATTRVSAVATATATATAAAGATATATATAGSGASVTVTATSGTTVTHTVTVADAATSIATATATAAAGARATSTATSTAPTTAGAEARATATSTAAAGSTATSTALATATATAAATADSTATAAAGGTATARATAGAGYSATATATAPAGATVIDIVTLPATATLNANSGNTTLYLADPQQRDVPTLDGGIVGGTDADIKNFPYQVSLQYLGNHICGGAIISSDWVLTTAHCLISPLPASFLTVRVGSATRNSGGQVIPVLTIISHPDYTRRSTIDYDIALLRLASSISTTNAQAIPLPNAGTGPTADSTAIISGWEALSEESTTSTNLQVIEVSVVSQDECRAAYSVSSITDRMFCAGRLGVDGNDACQGDSGSPVVINGTLVGLVSWGKGCAGADYPGVYTNVYSLRDWVYTNSGI